MASTASASKPLEPEPGPEADLESVLRYLRAIATSCEPPVGVGSFDVLYASQREIVVWYSPAREEHHEGEVTIPTVWLATAWASLVSGATLDEDALYRIGSGLAGGRWLLALLAQLPGVRVRDEPLILEWAAPAGVEATDAIEAPDIR